MHGEHERAMLADLVSYRVYNASYAKPLGLTGEVVCTETANAQLSAVGAVESTTYLGAKFLRL